MFDRLCLYYHTIKNATGYCILNSVEYEGTMSISVAYCLTDGSFFVKIPRNGVSVHSRDSNLCL